MQTKNKLQSSVDLATLDPKEIALIHYIRTRFKYGDIVIQTRDGLPYRILKVTEFQTLD